jgi:EAL domain-containing protein (putative c-di-GMP-specific phosphodiesterase class I)/GGDEF domain-containing protein
MDINKNLEKYSKINVNDYFVLILEITNRGTYSRFYDTDLSEKIFNNVYNELIEIFNKDDIVVYGFDRIMVISQFKNVYLSDQKKRYEEQLLIAEKIINRVTNQTFIFGDYNQYHTVAITIGCGSSGLIFYENKIDEIVKLAEFSLIKAKELKKSIIIADEELRIIKKDLDSFNKEMEKGLTLDEFNPYFLPVIDTSTMEIIGCESLVRWNKDTFRIIEASKFKAIALEKNLFKEIDNRIIEKTFQAFGEWIANNLVKNDFKISINLSNATISELNVANLMELIDQYNLNTKNIEFDISPENQLTEKELKTINILKKFEFNISYDASDFSNVSMDLLSKIKFDTLKIKLTDNLKKDDNRHTNSLLRIIVKLSKIMDYKLITKFIENKNDLDIVKSLGINLVEGYYFTLPLDNKGFQIYLEKYKEGIAV